MALYHGTLLTTTDYGAQGSNHIRTWHIGSTLPGRETGSIATGQGHIAYVYVHGALLFSTSIDGSIYILNEEYTVIHECKNAHNGSINHITRYTPQLLLSCGSDSVIKLWELSSADNTLACKAILKGHTGNVYRLLVVNDTLYR